MIGQLQNVREWLAIAKQKKEITTIEKEKRDKIVSLFFGTIATRGTKHAAVDGAMQLTLKRDFSYSVKREDIEIILPELTDADKEAIKWVPEVKPSIYRKLPDDSVLRKIVTVKPKAATLSAIDLEVA